MKVTRVRDLFVIAFIATALSWLIIRQWYGDLPRFRWFMPLPLAFLAVVEFFAALQLRARLRHRPGSLPINPLAAARELALAKASAWVGAATFGGWAGLLIYTVPKVGTVSAASGDTFAGVIGIVVSAALVAAAIWLEYCCRTPKPPEEKDQPRSEQR